MALIDKLNNLGDAVRERSGATEKMTLEQMAQQVKDIPYPVVDEITIRENGKYTAPSGIDGYSEVVVDIPEIVCPVPVVEGITITENGTYTPNEGVDGFNEVIVDIPEVVCPECPECPEVEPPVIEALAITENGVYTAPSGIDGYSPITVNVPSGGGGGIEVEPIVLTGDQSDAFTTSIAAKYIELFGDTVSTSDITKCANMFQDFQGKTIPFDINCKADTYVNFNYMFYNCNNLEVAPKINNCKGPSYLGCLFTICYNLREIPDDFCEGWDWSKIYTQSHAMAYKTFDNCRRLRKLPSNFINNYYTPYEYYCVYREYFSYCFSLEEVRDLIVAPLTLSSNAFNGTFFYCFRLKDITFETNEDGTPKTANWKGQTIDLTPEVGYEKRESASYTPENSAMIKYTDFTADKCIYDDMTYQALKDDPDCWVYPQFSQDGFYSRYNHDSAVATINSLPDTSAYLAANGGTNTIKFKGASGSLTDGGAINTLTEEEIAVAASKGWTVSLS